jgi:hypothetical protein
LAKVRRPARRSVWCHDRFACVGLSVFYRRDLVHESAQLGRLLLDGPRRREAVGRATGWLHLLVWFRRLNFDNGIPFLILHCCSQLVRCRIDRHRACRISWKRARRVEIEKTRTRTASGRLLIGSYCRPQSSSASLFAAGAIRLGLYFFLAGSRASDKRRPAFPIPPLARRPILGRHPCELLGLLQIPGQHFHNGTRRSDTSSGTNDSAFRTVPNLN